MPQDDRDLHVLGMKTIFRNLLTTMNAAGTRGGTVVELRIRRRLPPT